MPKIIDNFEIPYELALELSELLTRQTIRERLMMQNIGDKDRFRELEDLLVPITAKIESIKVKITEEYVPERYRYQRYSWNYDGYEVSQNVIQIIDNDSE